MNNKLHSLQWKVHPAREKPKTTIILIIFLLSVWTGIYLLFHEAFWVILSILFLGCALIPYFIKTEYIMDDYCIRIKRGFSNQKREWKTLRSFYPDKNGVLLSPFSKPSRLENFRGTYIRFGNNRDEVLKFIQSCIEKAHKK